MRRLTWALVALALTGQARADVLYSNLGPGESYDRISFTESGPDSGGAVRYAFAFMPSAGATFDEARLALGRISGANAMDLRLCSDAGGQPGIVLEIIHVSGQMPPLGMYTSGHLVTFDSATHPLLQAGDTYWLLAFASGDTFAGWVQNDQGTVGPVAFSREVDPTDWMTGTFIQGAFDVSGTPSPVPEPAGWVLAVTALAVAYIRGARLPSRRR